MACSCGKKKTESQKRYVYTATDGQTKVYKTEVEATAAAQRNGGTVRAQS
jgi:hypothetical protein